MPEVDHIIDSATITYSGLFSMRELYKLINTWCHEHQYDTHDIQNLEQIREDKRYLELVLLPYRKVSDYIKFDIKIKIVAADLIETVVEKNGMKTKLDKGNVTIVFNAFYITDYENKWSEQAVHYFIRLAYNKFINKAHMDKYKGQLVDDVNNLRDNLKAYLNIHRYQR
ncbi:MAG: hypothetical protein KAJ19_23290 [Gammaproteobacteria bacterium]|nr:hypothetical protein [Gammaproteobacteria bacterium]